MVKARWVKARKGVKCKQGIMSELGFDIILAN